MCSPIAALRNAYQSLAWHSNDSMADWSTAVGPIGGLERREFEAQPIPLQNAKRKPVVQHVPQRCQDEEADTAKGDCGSRWSATPSFRTPGIR